VPERRPERLATLTWVAAALAAGASLLRWAATDTQAHAWSVDALIALAAAAAQMTLAVLLVGRPAPMRDAASDRDSGVDVSRTVYLAGALINAAVVLAFVPALIPTAPTDPHGGHGGMAVGPAAIDALRLGIEVALIGVLLWLYRARRRDTPGDRVTAAGS
jgi:hypothetical protein